MRTLIVLGALLVGPGLLPWGRSAPAGEPPPPAAGQVILDETSHWRCHYTWRTPQLRKADALVDAPAGQEGGGHYLVETQPPPEDWAQPEFADWTWARWRLGKSRAREFDYGFRPAFGSPGPTMALQCLRGRFRVDDPARVQGLQLALVFRGGVAVYLNGKEVARANLPKDGKLDPLAPADDYPPEAFLRADGKPIRAEFSDPKGHPDRMEKRLRRLTGLELKPADLRKGVNVLAVEVHRAPYFGPGLQMENSNYESLWSTGGLVDLELRAAAGCEPGSFRAKGPQVWNASVLTRLTPGVRGDPCEPLGPVVIPAARNGSFTAKVAVTSDEPIRDLKAEVGDLIRSDGKAKIPAAAVGLRYTVRDDRPLCRYGGGAPFWDTLVEAPPAEQLPAAKGGLALQPVWIKVRVPADAVPGEYQGKLAVTVAGAKLAEAPVRLTVADWKLPDPQDWTGGHLGFIQSPDTLALFYKKDMWSEEHWKLIEESFKLMGEMGNRYVFVPLISRTNFGNEQSMVRWVKDGDGYKHDYAVFDRYLDLAQKYMKPDVVCLYAWDRYTGQSMWGGKGDFPGSGAIVTQLDPATGKASDLIGPRLGTPEAKEFWEPVYREVRARLEKRGLLAQAMLGMNGDAYWPRKDIAAQFREMWPGAKWINNSHADSRGGNMNGIPIAYNTAVYVNIFPPPSLLSWDAKRKIGWRLTNKSDLFTRSQGPATKLPLYHTQQLGLYRLTVEAALFANYSGVGRAGFDFWPVLGKESIREGVKHSATVGARWLPCWDQLNLDRATENVVAPGPGGALPTERFENLREGMQEVEARVFIEKALIDPAARGRLGEELAKKCQQVLDDRQWRIRGACLGGTSFEFADAEPFREELYNAAAAVAAKLSR